MFCLIMYYFRDDRVEQEYFGLCEVEVFDYKSKYYLEIDSIKYIHKRTEGNTNKN